MRPPGRYSGLSFARTLCILACGPLEDIDFLIITLDHPGHLHVDDTFTMTSEAPLDYSIPFTLDSDWGDYDFTETTMDSSLSCTMCYNNSCRRWTERTCTHRRLFSQVVRLVDLPVTSFETSHGLFIPTHHSEPCDDSLLSSTYPQT